MSHPVSRIGAAILIVVAGYAVSPAAQSTAGGGQAGTAPQAAAPTPRTPDGKPDLSGMWTPPPPVYRGVGSPSAAQRASGLFYGSRRCVPNQKDCREWTNQNADGEFIGRMNPNRPVYHPDYWDKVQDLDYNTNFQDPMFRCLPDGVPRVGPPVKIVQTPTDVIFFYASARNHDYRIVPIDGRPHHPIRSQDISFYGDAVGNWEGDTLVVDSKGFNDITWLSNRGGYLHSVDLRVIERFRREGNTLHYQVTVEDPQVLLQPWVMDPQILRLNPNPKAIIFEGDPCRDYDLENNVTRIRQ